MPNGQANIAVLIKAKDEASQTLKNVSGNTKDMSKQFRMAGMAMVAAGSAIVGVLGMSIKHFAKAGDEVQKMALRTGFATEALSELRHALEISGADLSVVDKAAKKMSKTIVDASEGMATYIRTFDRIGLSAEELLALKPEEQFMRIAMAIADLEDQTLKTATAQDIFGRAGTQLLPLLAEGREGIEALRKEAHELGIVFDQEAADKAAKFNDAMHRMREAISGLKYDIAEILVPVVTGLVTKITSVIVKIRELTEAIPGLYEKIVLVGSGVGIMLIPMGMLLIMLPSLAAGIHMVTASLIPFVATVVAAYAPLIALAYGLGMVYWGITQLQRQTKLTREYTELKQREVGLSEYYNTVLAERDKLLASEENRYEAMLAMYEKTLIALYADIEAHYKKQGITLELVESTRAYFEQIKAQREEQEKLVAAVDAQADAQRELNQAMIEYHADMARAGGLAASLIAYYGEAWALSVGTPGRIEAMRKHVRERGEVPKFQYGGVVAETGLAMVHRHEVILPAGGRTPIQSIIHIYLDGEEVTRTIVERITEKVGLQGAT